MINEYYYRCRVVSNTLTEVNKIRLSDFNEWVKQKGINIDNYDYDYVIDLYLKDKDMIEK